VLNIRRTSATVALSLAILFLIAIPARADQKTEVVCDPYTGICVVVVVGGGSDPGSGTSPGTSGVATCHGPTGEIPCYDPAFGWYSEVDGCYYQKANPQPRADDPAWQGHYPDGAVYLASCPGVTGTGGGLVWRQDPPPGFGGANITAAELAIQAVRRMQLLGPDIGMVPESGKVGLVGLPVWLWTEVSSRTWGPISVTASVPGLSVTASANAEQISWRMGDGHTVVCRSPGTPYADRFGGRSSPNCGHTYTRTSARVPGGAYPVTATTTWRVVWVGGGQRGELTLARSTTTRVRIGELQVLVQ
jgi:hypothetical protein